MARPAQRLSSPREPGTSADETFDVRDLPDESLGYLIREAHRAFSKRMHVRLARHDVTVGQWAFLRVLWEGDGHTQRELADRLSLMEPSAMFILNGLVSRGLVRREQDPADGRKRNIRLTPAGWALKSQLLPYAREVNALALEGLDPGEVHRTIRTLIENLQRDELEENNGKLHKSRGARVKRKGK